LKQVFGQEFVTCYTNQAVGKTLLTARFKILQLTVRKSC